MVAYCSTNHVMASSSASEGTFIGRKCRCIELVVDCVFRSPEGIVQRIDRLVVVVWCKTFP